MSTKEVLSDDEIEALMDTVDEAPADPAALDDNGDYQLFDFTARDGALLSQMPALKTVNEKVCKELESTLLHSFRMPFDVALEDMEILKLDECLKSLSEFSAINLLKFDITSGLSLAVISGNLLSEVINRYFGSSFDGSGLPQEERALTPTEERMNERLLSHVLAALQIGWQEITPLEVKLLATETNPDFVKLGSPEDMAVRFRIKLTLGEFEESVYWMLPYAALESLRPKLGNLARPLSDEKNKKNWSQLLTQQLSAVELDLTAVFTNIEISLNDVLQLKEGSILPMRAPDMVKVHSGGIPMFAGEYGTYESNKAISVKRKLSHADT